MSVRHDSGSRLLLHEQPLQVLPSLAKLLGINAAIAIQQIHWVICIKEENEDNRTLFDGYLWCKYTISRWQNKLCWLTPDGIYKILRKLESDGLVVCCKPDSHNRDQTKWYRIDYENLANLSDSVQTPISDSVQTPISDSVQTPISDSVQTPISDSVQNDLYQKDLKDLKKKDADDFFTIAPSSLNQGNSFPVQTIPRIQETPNPQSPLSPLPENLPKKVVVDKMGDRFRAGKPKHRYSVLVSTNPEWQVLDDWCTGKQLGDFKPSLIKATIAHLKKWENPFEAGDAINCLSGYIKRRDLDGFEGRVKDALKLESAEAIADQQRQAPTEIPQQQSAPQIDPIARKRMIEEARRRVAQQAA